MRGDADLDGHVSWPDFQILQASYGDSGGYLQGDFDLDGTTNADEIAAHGDVGLDGGPVGGGQRRVHFRRQLGRTRDVQDAVGQCQWVGA